MASHEFLGWIAPSASCLLFLFGSVGGWLLSTDLSPSGLVASSFVLLFTAAPLALLALLVGGFRLLRRPERSIYHRVAIYGSFGYPGLPSLLFLIIGAISATFHS